MTSRREFLRAGVTGAVLCGGCLRLDQDDDASQPTATTASSTSTTTDAETETATETTTETESEPQCAEERQVPADAAGSWTQFQGDPANTGYRPGESVSESLACPAWEFRGEGQPASPVAADDVVVYPGTFETRSLIALDRRTGEVRWRSDETVGEEMYPAGAESAVVDGTLYTYLYDSAGTHQEQVVAIDVATGEESWRTDFESSDTEERLSGGVTVADGCVYAASQRRLRALSTADGSQRWSATTDWGVFHSSPPAVADGTVVVSVDDADSDGMGGGAMAFDADTGAHRWTADLGRVESAPTVADGSAYLARSDGPNTLCAVDLGSGDVRWEFETLNGTHASPAVADGSVYFGDGDGNLYAVDAADGTGEWTFEAGVRMTQAGQVVAGDTVLAGAIDVGGSPGLYAVDAATGEPRWKFETTYDVYAAPAVADGVVFLPTQIGSLYALV